MKNLYILILFPLFAIGQTGTQNYVKSSTYIDATPYPLAEESEEYVNKQDEVTYLDGIGRPIQKIVGKSSGDGKDIVTHIEYDVLGRQAMEYLPYKSGNTDLSFQPAAEANTLLFYNTGYYENTLNPYVQKFFEPSPLQRVKKQAAPGQPWQGNQNNDNDHTVKYSYVLNQANEVKKYDVIFSDPTNTELPTLDYRGYYRKNELYKNIVKDENWTSSDGTNKTTEEFVDAHGKIILKRYYNDNQQHNTYYVYDKYSNLTFVIPPLAENVGYDVLVTEPSGPFGPGLSYYKYLENDNILESLCYIYHYDFRNRMVEKKIPGKQWEYIVYDKRDRVVANGPVLNPFGGNEEGWMYTYYEGLDRAAFTGWYPGTTFNTVTRIALQSEPQHSGIAQNVGRGPGTINTIALDYKPPVLQSGFQLLTVNYYDTYGFPDFSAFSNANIITQAKSLPTGTWNRVLSANTDTFGILSYDGYNAKGISIVTLNKNTYFNTEDIVQKSVNWRGLLEGTTTTHKRTGFPDLIVYDDFDYDNIDRPTKHRQAYKSFTGWDMTQNWEEIIKQEYDDLGELKRKKIGGFYQSGYGEILPLQTVDYTYNIRGWLKGINDLNYNLALGDDLFAFKINYNNPEINSNAVFNGNISETQWRSRNDDKTRIYSYTYDDLNRLTNANYYDPVSPSQNGRYNEGNISYDLNGNILTLSRWGRKAAGTYGQIDQLAYTYPLNSNLLTKVVDTIDTEGFNNGSTNLNNDYLYDENGNMITDLNKGIGALGGTGIIYNHLNLPTRINFDTSTKYIDYVYDASGAKLQKKVTSSGTAYTTTQYTSGFVYEASQSATNQLKFFPHTEGYVKVGQPVLVNGVLKYNTFDYFYQYKDHLGNIRLTYSDNDDDGVIDNTQNYQDGFESQSGWISEEWWLSISAYDSSFKRTGNYSGKIENSGTTEKYAHCSRVMKIDNNIATSYTYSGWVYSNGPSAQLFLIMKTDDETGYATLTDYVSTSATGAWTFVTKTFSVPANIKQLFLRIDNNSTGTVWFDDLQLKRTTITNEIMEEDNYYPFGMKHKGYNTTVLSSTVAAAQKFKFNGIELQDELDLDLYAMDLRHYDPAIGRWIAIDPITHHNMSPYAAFNNNPVYYADPSGGEGIDPITETNTVITSSVDKSNNTHITQTTVTTTTTIKNGNVNVKYKISSITNTVDANGNITKGTKATETSGEIKRDSEGHMTTTKNQSTTRTIGNNETTNLNKWSSHISQYNKSHSGVYNVDMINETADYTTKSFEIGMVPLGKVVSGLSIAKKLNEDVKNFLGIIGVATSAEGGIAKAGEKLKDAVGKNNNYFIIYGVSQTYNGSTFKSMKTPNGGGDTSRKRVGPTSWQELWEKIKFWD